MKTTGVVPEAFAASISLLSRCEMDAMPNWIYLRSSSEGSEIAPTSSPVLSFSLSAMSAWATMPTSLPFSTTGQPPNLVAGHELERVVKAVVGLDTDEAARIDIPD